MKPIDGRSVRVGIASVFVLLTCLCVFVPLSPRVPFTGVDWSWMLGLNQAVAQHLGFGDRITFTFGPYAAAYTALYGPVTDASMLWATAYLAIAYFVCLATLMRRGQPTHAVALCVALASLAIFRDVLFYSYPLLLALTFLPLDDDARSVSTKAWIVRAFTLTPLGLLPLIKGSFLPICAAAVVLYALAWIAKKRYRAASLAIAIPFMAMHVFWWLSGQPAGGLYTYLESLYPVIAGYSEAMEQVGKRVEIVCYLVTTITVLGYIAFKAGLDATSRLFLLAIFGLYLFLMFKAGFVRHDGHAQMASVGLLIGALLLTSVSSSDKVSVACLILSVITWGVVDRHYARNFPGAVVGNFEATYRLAYGGLVSRVTDRAWTQRRHDQAMAAIRADHALPVLSGTTDLYAANQALLFASGNVWSPRPTFQSYQAYTAALIEGNAAHLASSNAPDWIFFHIEPVDGRLPSTEDGRSWSALLSRYEPADFSGDYLTLKKRQAPRAQPVRAQALHVTAKLGEPIDVPSTSTGLTWATVIVTPTWMGKLSTIVFKPAILRMQVRLTDGTLKSFRIVSSMTRSTFLLSPLIEETSDFRLLFERDGSLARHQVKSFSIEADRASIRTWNDEIGVDFSNENGS